MDRVGRDALLVVRAQLGDRRSLADLVGHWHDPMWRYVRSMLGAADLADDVTQEVWAAALKGLRVCASRSDSHPGFSPLPGARWWTT